YECRRRWPRRRLHVQSAARHKCAVHDGDGEPDAVCRARMSRAQLLQPAPTITRDHRRTHCRRLPRRSPELARRRRNLGDISSPPFAGLNPIDANASSVVALFSGTFAGAWAYRRNILAVAEFSVLGLFVLSLVGGL